MVTESRGAAPAMAVPAVVDAAVDVLADALGVDAARVSTVSREPLGRGSVVGLTVAPADGVVEEVPLHYYVDTSGLAVAAETGLVCAGPGTSPTRVWLHPADPHLPSLAPAAFGQATRTLLARLGIAASGAPELVAYRPGRRAVVTVRTDEGRSWIKVVRPSRVERIVGLHERLAAADVPLPALRGWSAEGVIVLDDATGAPASRAEWDPDRLLDAVADLRSRIARAEVTVGNRSVSGRLRWYAERATVLVGADRAGALATSIDDLLRSGAAARPETVVHGDLHFGQLFLDADGRVTSVVDVDTAGVGSPAEDEGAFVAHAVASALLTRPGPGRERLHRLVDAARRRWCTNAATRALTAIHLIGHALAAGDRRDEAMTEALLSAAQAVVDDGDLPFPLDTKNALTSAFEAP